MDELETMRAWARSVGLWTDDGAPDWYYAPPGYSGGRVAWPTIADRWEAAWPPLKRGEPRDNELAALRLLRSVAPLEVRQAEARARGWVRDDSRAWWRTPGGVVVVYLGKPPDWWWVTGLSPSVRPDGPGTAHKTEAAALRAALGSSPMPPVTIYDHTPEEEAAIDAASVGAVRAALGEPVAVVAPDAAVESALEGLARASTERGMLEAAIAHAAGVTTRADVVGWLRVAPLKEVQAALTEAKVCEGWALWTEEGCTIERDGSVPPVPVEMAQLWALDGTMPYGVESPPDCAAAMRDAEDQAIADGYRVPWREE